MLLVPEGASLGRIRSPTEKILVIALLALIVLLAWPQSAYAQTSYWAKSYGGAAEETTPSVQQTSDKGYVVASTTASFGAGDHDVWVVKLDGNGNVQWQKTYGGTGYDAAASVQETSDGYVVAGMTGLTAGTPNSWKAWVFKIDRDGDMQWEYTYGGANGEVVTCMQKTSDGGFVVGGRTASVPPERLVDFWALKLDSNGNRQWDHTYGGAGEDRRIESILQTGDGGYVFAGTTLTWPDPSRVWVIKVDADGDSIQWQKTYTPTFGADLEDMQLTTDGSLVLLAETSLTPGGPQDWWVFKIDSDGDIQWEKTYGGTGNEDAQPILATSDGGCIVAGGTTSFGVAGEDAWLVKLDANGNIQWQRTYGGAGDDEAWSVDETSDGGYVAAVVTTSFGSGGDIWILKLDSLGRITGCEPIRTTAAAITTTHATVGQQALIVSSIALQGPTHATITDTSITPIAQCFAMGAVPTPVGGVIEVKGRERLSTSWILLVALVALALVVAHEGFKLRRSHQLSHTHNS